MHALTAEHRLRYQDWDYGTIVLVFLALKRFLVVSVETALLLGSFLEVDNRSQQFPGRGQILLRLIRNITINITTPDRYYTCLVHVCERI